ncbi:hypothetical protein H2508_09835 [Parahaliea sp. F7430]|uniref:Uncharacterized protein n=1 Tax=Sediminihaliea albiluteola TaxID=2758564 RepID=A0A7W2YJS9_9GAMM|nr:hypothetical protein [Sediminihaliea albiluteola]MBA6413407.1 hypothetical protein [Sediminihaliea albiluteola]
MEEAERERIIEEGRLEQEERDRSREKILSIGNFFLYAIPVLFCISGRGVFATQVFGYLYNGVWKSISLANFIGGFYMPWAYSEPKTWIGLWNIINIIPLSFALIVFGLWVFTRNSANRGGSKQGKPADTKKLRFFGPLILALCDTVFKQRQNNARPRFNHVI